MSEPKGPKPTRSWLAESIGVAGCLILIGVGVAWLSGDPVDNWLAWAFAGFVAILLALELGRNGGGK